MCDLASGFIHKQTMELLMAHPLSHSKSADLLGGIDRTAYAEWEYKPDESLKVRTHHDGATAERRLNNAIRRKYPTFASLLPDLKEAARKHKILLMTDPAELAELRDSVGFEILIHLTTPGPVSLPLLATSGYIDARAATSLSLPLLATSGYIDARAATSLSLPLLATSGDIDARAATSLSLPLLATSGYIDAPAATSLSLPLLAASGDIDARAATSLSLPLLATSGYIDARAATSLSLPLLATSGDIDARAATSLSLPLLAASGYIDAPAATSLEAPLVAANVRK